MQITANIDENIKNIEEYLHIEQNFDLIFREFYIGPQKAALYFVDGTGDTTVMTEMMKFFMSNNGVPQNQPFDSQKFTEHFLPFGEIVKQPDFEKATTAILAGMFVLFIDQITDAYIIDAKSFPQRDVGEPDKDKVIRGSRDGFVEIPVFNAALIRRRIRDPNLILEAVEVGEQSKSQVVMCYIKGKCDEVFLDKLHGKLKNMKVQALTMNQETLAEHLIKPKWYNPYPQFRYSERPDTTSAAILQGSIVILTDNSPAAMILPSKFIDFFNEANDYYFPPMTGCYFRIVRLMVALLSFLLTPLWLTVSYHPEIVPEALKFVLISDPVPTPLWLQLLIIDFVFEAMRISSINTPSSLGNAMSIVGALLVGDFAVKSGWMSSETVFYMAFISVAMYVQPNFELGYALKFFRIFLIIMIAFLDYWGLFIGLVVIALISASTRTVEGRGYFFPILPLNIKQFFGYLGRGRLRR